MTSARVLTLFGVGVAAFVIVVLLQQGGPGAPPAAALEAATSSPAEARPTADTPIEQPPEKAPRAIDAETATDAPTDAATAAAEPVTSSAPTPAPFSDNGPAWAWAAEAPGAGDNLGRLQRHTFAELEPVANESIPPLPRPFAEYPDTDGDSSRDTTDYVVKHGRLAREGTNDLWKYTLWDEACDVYWTNECFGERGSTPGVINALKKWIFETNTTALGGDRYPVVCLSNLQVLKFAAHVLRALHEELQRRRDAGDRAKYGFVLYAACHDAAPKGLADGALNRIGGSYGHHTPSNAAFEYIQASPLLIHMFGTNLDARLVAPSGVEKGSAVPLGVDFHTEGGHMSSRDQSRRLHDGANLPFAERALKVVADYAVYRDGAVSPIMRPHLISARLLAMNHYHKEPWFYHLRADKPHLYRTYSTHAFVLSPPGHGYECHRTFEALYRGAIAIIVKGAIQHEAYDGLPVIVVDDVVPRGLSEPRLRRWLDEAIERQRQGLFDMRRLDVRYWINRIRNAAASRTHVPTAAELNPAGLPAKDSAGA